MKKMIESYKRDVVAIEKRIAEIKLQIEKDGDASGRLTQRIFAFRREREDLLYSITMMTEYVEAVESRRKGVA